MQVFFHKFWLEVGSLVVRKVKKIFADSKVLEILNRTHIAWIPKIQGPETLDEFCSILEQSVSDSKSRVYFSPNVDRDIGESLCDILDFTSTPFLGKYLGFPLKQPGSSSHDYNFILDRVKQKLLGWKANMLSLAGRLVLIQAFLAAIPSYVMQCSSLPARIFDGIDRVNRNFP
ncbi:hypothetical protein SO802_006943 [Lithocarpus litseifolius]|uniref:Reverse transcriptase n=1 Tax=Lithocarpus litseifolius TaxID=425828 RepID=A0AAW2DMA0_9ROSI